MSVYKRTVLTSAVTALVAGAILTVGGFAPPYALSYAVTGSVPSVSERLLTVSVPGLPPSARSDAPAATDPGTDTPTADEASDTIQPEPENTDKPTAEEGKPIVKKTFASSLSVNNLSPQKIDIPALLRHIPDIDLTSDGPQILIVHTHTTESYNETDATRYTQEDVRSDDPRKNMISMGEILDETLTAAGYRVIHCQTVHDKNFNQSYTNSNRTIREYLEKYPSLAVVIDLHRDSLIDSRGTKYRPVVTIDGEETAQIMLLMGVGSSVYPHPDWQENMSLALRIQKEATETYPGLMRPIMVRASRYNQHLSHGAILVELGSCGNTPEEAERAARRFGEICAAALDRIREEQE